MNAVSLYKLTEQFHGLQALADEDLPLEAIADSLEAITGEIQTKAVNVAAFTLNMEAWAAAAEDAGEKLLERAKRIRRRAAQMREYLRSCMQAADIKKIEAEQFTITRKPNPPKVIIEPDTEVPDEYLQPPEPVIYRIMRAMAHWVDKRATEDAREAGNDHGGAIYSIPHDALLHLLLTIFPKQAPDKKKIADALKAHAAEVAREYEAATKAGRGMPIIPHPLPGCRLDQGERLEIRV